jgi:hypothetical protein
MKLDLLLSEEFFPEPFQLEKKSTFLDQTFNKEKKTISIKNPSKEPLSWWLVKFFQLIVSHAETL